VKAIQQLKCPTLAYPKQPTRAQYTDANGDFDEDGFDMAKFAWKEDYKGMKYQMDKYKDNESNARALIYDQCSPELKNKLEGTSGYDSAKSSNDIIKLLTIIRGYCCQFVTLNDEYMLIVKLLKNLVYFFQKPDQTNSEFHEDFMALVEVIEEYGGTGSLTHFPNMIKKELLSKNIMDPSKASADDLKEAKGVVREKFLAALMLNGANASKYGELKRSMAENYVTGTSEYPESPEVVLRILNAYQPPAGWNTNRRKQEAGTGTNKGAMFAQTDNDNWKADIKCYKCGEKGHLAWECTKKKTKEAEQMHATIAEEEGQDLDEGENIFVQSGTRGGVNRSYVLLDNQSIINQILNRNLLDNIRKTKNPITVHCNNGSSCTNLEGDLGGMIMYHNPYGIGNALSLNSTKAKHRVTYDSWDCDGVFKVHTKDGIVEFKPSEKGLHYHDTSKDGSNFECMLVNNVRDNFEGHILDDEVDATINLLG
jgi:hypothetical protein